MYVINVSVSNYMECTGWGGGLSRKVSITSECFLMLPLTNFSKQNSFIYGLKIFAREITKNIYFLKNSGDDIM